MISRKQLFGKLSPTAFRSIESAATLCKLRGNPYIELAHWLHQIIQLADSDLHRILHHFGLPEDEVDQALDGALRKLPSGASSISNFSHHIEIAIERAWVIATIGFGDNKVRTGYLILALLQAPELRPGALEAIPSLRRIPVEVLGDLLPSLLKSSQESGELAYDNSGFEPAAPGESSGAIPTAQGSGSALDRYCNDLTQQAREGAIDPVLGREQEIRTMIDILLRRRQNNPLLTGEAGVGKTAVVEGLALALAQGNVPPALQDVRLLSLDVGALLAGASMKGEFESRLKSVLEEIKRSTSPIILFVDEVHTLIGAGGASGTGDAANLLKPALARGGLRTIGATTWSEYKRHIEKDAALTRRFQVLQVEEPSDAMAVVMLRGLVPTLESHHRVLILDEAVRAAVSFSSRYIPSRQLPDKAISLLDTACSRVALSLHTPPGNLQLLRRDQEALLAERELIQKQYQIGRGSDVSLNELDQKLVQLSQDISGVESRWQAEREQVETLIAERAKEIEANRSDAQQPSLAIAALQKLEADLKALQGDTPLVHPEVGELAVASIVAEWTGIPVGRMVKDELAAVIELPMRLARRVIGQQHALDQIAERIQVARSGLCDPQKPVGVFLLAGPSGVGKTETAMALAEALYGGEQNLITINMSEFQEAHTVSTLKGAPPGYVGYGEGGVLTEAVRRRPHSVILLDEIEKAHPDVHEIFFQVFDKGSMEDGEGRHIDFKNTVILLTSNVGAEHIQSLCEDPDLMPAPAALEKALRPELLKTFPAAFLGRVQSIPFLPLASHTLSGIVALQLDRIRQRMLQQHAIELQISPDVVTHIVNACTVAESGARILINYIERNLLPLLGRFWLESVVEQKEITQVELAIHEGALIPRIYHRTHQTHHA